MQANSVMRQLRKILTVGRGNGVQVDDQLELEFSNAAISLNSEQTTE